MIVQYITLLKISYYSITRHFIKNRDVLITYDLAFQLIQESIISAFDEPLSKRTYGTGLSRA